MYFLLKHLGKHEIGEYVDEIVRTHVGSPHIRGSSPYEFTNGLYNNLDNLTKRGVNWFSQKLFCIITINL